MLCSWKFIALLFWVVVLLVFGVLGWFFFFWCFVLLCTGEVLSGVDFLTRFGIDLSI